ncbi:CHAP domain-containing protein [Novosphingobium panipatense]|uniref:CHAP domain-containing protein n=1 Tax=Novosphingobium panipatense TaxID=428991 RepID=A0ABY1PXK5_9SPHN|nr:CHAP domain-containing protein [Novosphingobium panipatense]SMP52107.1 CHAP domain-containing protein [Novosphingobium panipatense]
MRVQGNAIVLGLAAMCAAASIPTASARAVPDTDARDDSAVGAGFISSKPPGHPAGDLECVPYARTTSGIQLYGDAWTWWTQAQGRYATGTSPRVGAVMAIKPFNNSRLGHVATVSRIIDSRTVLLSHANWSVPGQVERNVTALDVSPANDWSRVRIWYAPARGLGTTHWPVAGFIYNSKPGSRPEARERAETARLATAARASNGKGRRSDPIGAIIAGAY